MGQDLIKPIDQRVRNRQLVLEAVLRSPGISRTALADAIGLNVASVSRITRALIDAGLIMEADSFGPRDRPGRRFVGLKPCGEGGYAIGIAINAFHQTVTLADLSNSKIDEWNSPETPGPCGEEFLRLCLQNAADLVDTHVRDKGRLLGVGIAVAGELDAQRGYVQSAPILGWTDPVNVARLVKEILDVPLVLATPPNAMNAADADIGLGQQIENLTTLNCSLGYGIGARQGAVNGQALEFGRIVAGIKAPGSDLTLAQVCGGTAVLRQVYGVEGVEGIPDYQLGGMLIELIQKSKTDTSLQEIFRSTGELAAGHLALVVDLCQPDRLVLVGPMVGSQEFVAGFKRSLKDAFSKLPFTPEVVCSDMTPARASRWLALKGNLSIAVQNLEALTVEDAA